MLVTKLENLSLTSVIGIDVSSVFFFIFHIEPIFTFEPVLNFGQGLNITATARFGGDFDVQNDGQVKRAGRAEFMKRVYDEPKSFLEALSSIFDVPFYSNRQG